MNKKRIFFLLTTLLLTVLAVIPVQAAEVEDVSILPDWLLEETRKPGEIIEVIYPSIMQVDSRGGVYLPYGYDENKLYDVAFFFPGTGGSYTDAFTYAYPNTFESGVRDKISIQHLLDRLIEKKVIRPLIVVCMEDMTHENFYVADEDFKTFYAYINETYSTYASDESISQEEYREHSAVLGFSQGAIFAEAFGMGVHFDDFAYTGSFSFGSYWRVLETVPTSPYELGLLYVCSGTNMDKGAYDSKYNYEIIVNNCGDKVRDGDNAIRTEAYLCDHTYSLVVAALNDCLPMMFPAEKQPRAVTPPNSDEGRLIQGIVSRRVVK